MGAQGATGAESDAINILFVWSLGHKMNYTRFLHLLLKIEVSVCVYF